MKRWADSFARALARSNLFFIFGLPQLAFAILAMTRKWGVDCFDFAFSKSHNDDKFYFFTTPFCLGLKYYSGQMPFLSREIDSSPPR